MNRLTPRNNKTKRRLAVIIASGLVALLIGSAVLVQRLYNQAKQPLSNSQSIILVEVPTGYSTKQIASKLKDKNVIKEAWAFEWYVRNSSQRDNLKAGTYALRQSQSVPEIVDILAQGEVATDLVTIVPGYRLDQVQATLINSGFKPDDVARALKPEQYSNHPALVDKPEGVSLEGYLYPESFQKTAETKPEDIIRASLNEMQKRLTPTWRAAVTRQGLNAHEAIILASIIEQEVSNEADQHVAAQVFLKRLRIGHALESDVTVLYGAIADGKPPKLSYDSLYNTFTHVGLPIGPIGSVTESSLGAVSNPSATDYMFFVAGDDGKTYFSNTLAEHQAAVEAHCKRLCQQ